MLTSQKLKRYSYLDKAKVILRRAGRVKRYKLNLFSLL